MKSVTAIEKGKICISGQLELGEHDLLMYTLVLLKQRPRTRESAICITDLEKFITYHQCMVGIEPGAVHLPLQTPPQPLEGHTE